MLVGPKEIEDFPDHKLVVISTGSQGEPLSALRRMAARRPPARGAARRRHRDLLRHPDPGQRARGERDDRPHLPPGRRRDHRRRRAHPRLGPRLRGGAEADAQPHEAASTCCPCTATTSACACTPSWPRPWACRRSRSSGARTACRSRSTPTAPSFGEREQAGMIFVDGVDVGDIEDVALRDRRMLSADGIFIVVATVSEQDGRSVADAGDHLPRRALPRRGGRASSTSCATRSRVARPLGRGGGHARSTSCRATCTTTWRSSSTTACSAGRWCCRWSWRSSRRPAMPREAAVVDAAGAQRGVGLAGSPRPGS